MHIQNYLFFYMKYSHPASILTNKAEAHYSLQVISLNEHKLRAKHGKQTTKMSYKVSEVSSSSNAFWGKRFILIRQCCTHTHRTDEPPPPSLLPSTLSSSRVWLMALLTGVLVSVTELIKMHMFGIIHRLSRPGRGETTRQIYVNYQPVSLSLIGTRVTQESGFGWCIIKL